MVIPSLVTSSIKGHKHTTKAAQNLLVGDVVRLAGGNKNAEDLLVGDVVELA